MRAESSVLSEALTTSCTHSSTTQVPSLSISGADMRDMAAEAQSTTTSSFLIVSERCTVEPCAVACEAKDTEGSEAFAGWEDANLLWGAWA